MTETTALQKLCSKPAALLGFRKQYNTILFAIFGTVMLFFCVTRLPWISPLIYQYRALPGEWYWWRSGFRKIGLFVHLGTILPAGTLAVFQFIPIIRQKYMQFHRMNGWLTTILVLISNIAALTIARRTFGGAISTQAAIYVLAIMTTTSLVLATVNIRRLQIDQHRAWMLRAWFYLGTIITTRGLMTTGAIIISYAGSYFNTVSCGELEYTYREDLQYLSGTYPQCNGTNPSQHVVVEGTLFMDHIEQIEAALRLSFGMALWIAIFLHAVGVEFYLNLTPKEATRLRQVSAMKQRKAGYEKPGSAGLVPEKFGDADEWQSSLAQKES